MSELRAATRLCRPGLAGTEHDQRSQALGALLETFTEGFETADLREARSALS